MAKAGLDIQTIFNRAIELEEGQARLEFLEEACAGDSAIRDRVDALLRAHSEAGNIFAGAPQCDVTTLSQEGSALIGSQVGPHKLLEQIGEGGMGVVYLAEQKRPTARPIRLWWESPPSVSLGRYLRRPMQPTSRRAPRK